MPDPYWQKVGVEREQTRRHLDKLEVRYRVPSDVGKRIRRARAAFVHGRPVKKKTI